MVSLNWVRCVGAMGIWLLCGVLLPATQGEAALVTGDVAFVGVNADGSDGFAFVALTSVASNSTIYFSDNEWSGSAFNSGESVITWQSGVSTITAGSVIRVSNLASGVITADVGAASMTGVGGLGTANEGLFAYTGVDADTPDEFLTAFFNSTIAGGGSTLTGTGLTVGTDTLEFGTGHDVFEYTGTRSGAVSLASYKPLVHDTAQWTTQDGAGDQSNDSRAPDVPFNATAFSTVSTVPEPPAMWLALIAGVGIALFRLRQNRVITG